MEHLPNFRDEMEKLTYVEAMEFSGHKGPQSARERHLLNVLSYQCDSMRSSMMVLDKSQSITRTQMCHGIVLSYHDIGIHGMV